MRKIKPEPGFSGWLPLVQQAQPPHNEKYLRNLTNCFFSLQDIDETDSDRWCEYIMYRGLVRLGYARISHGGLSDTEAQIAKFRIPLAGEKYQDNVILTTSPKDVTEDIRFSNR